MTQRILSIVLLMAASLSAQVAPASPPASREDIIHLFQVLRLETQITAVQQMIRTQVDAAIRENMAERLKTVPPEQRAKYEEFIRASVEEAQNIYPLPEMLNDFVPVYQKHLTKSDVDALVGFFTSPAGQRFIELGPRLAQEGLATIMPKMQDRMRANQELMQKRLEELRKSMETPAPPPKK